MMMSHRTDFGLGGWTALPSLWGVWLFGIFASAGQSFLQTVIWGGALVVGSASLPLFLRRFRRRRLPLEVQLLVAFWLWSLLGIVIAVEFELFIRYSRQILQLILITVFLSSVIAESGAIKPVYLAFVAVGALMPVAQTLGIETGFSIETLQSGQRVNEANALGFQSVIGVLGVLALLPESRSWVWRGVLLTAGAIAVYGVVLSAARGALVALALVFALWPLFCFGSLLRSRWTVVIFVVVLAVLGYQFYEFILQETNLGRRFDLLQRFEDGSSQMRLDLFFMSFELAFNHYGLGVGLGQFGIASGTGLYAHNEFAELLASTGVVGVVLYYLAYLTTWRRLKHGAKRRGNRTVLYRINFAKMMLVVVLLSGLMFRINFLGQDTMFVYALIVGISLWAVRTQPRPGLNIDLRDESTRDESTQVLGPGALSPSGASTGAQVPRPTLGRAFRS